MLNKSAHLDRFVSTHSANLTSPSSTVSSPRVRKIRRSDAYFSAKFWGLLAASGFSVLAWIVVFRLVINFLHAA